MNGITLLILLFIVIYIAFKYLKGPGNSGSYRDDFNMRPHDGMDGWNVNAPSELSENDETEAEVDGEDLDEIGFDKDEADDAEDIYKFTESVIQKVTIPEEPAAEIPASVEADTAVPLAHEMPVSPPSPVLPATASAAQPEASVSYGSMQDQPVQEVVIDSEVRIDTHMPPDNN